MNMKSAFKKPATYVDYDERLTWWVKWIATAMAIGCATLSSLDVYPYNVWLGFLAGVGFLNADFIFIFIVYTHLVLKSMLY